MRKVKTGDTVRCVYSRDNFITKDRLYTVQASEGEPDPVCGGYVLPDGIILINDRGNQIYVYFPDCLFGDFELVEDYWRNMVRCVARRSLPREKVPNALQ